MQSQQQINRTYAENLRHRIQLHSDLAGDFMKASYKYEQGSFDRKNWENQANEQLAKMDAYRCSLELFVEMNKGNF